ncbi:MAG: putative lyase, partial [uncultured Thermomicrobiales bacterium]
WTSPFTRASSRTRTRTPRWPSTGTPSVSRSATTSDTAACAGSRSARPPSPPRPSSCTRP